MITTTPIRAAENNLFAGWRVGRASFNEDGVVDEAGYVGASLKLLFVLKEVNGREDGFDLRTFLHGGARPQTWDNITRWVEAIFASVAGGGAPSWEHFEHIDADRRTRALRQICAVNLKKAGGIYTVDNDELAAAALADAEFLRAQLDLYRADFTIACGSAVTAAIEAHQLLDCRLDFGSWRRTQRGVYYHAAGKHGVLIDYSHPAARVSPNLLLYGLLDAVAEIRGTVVA